MRKKIYQHQHVLNRYYKKFCNLQKRIRLLMQNGEFFHLPIDIRNRLIRRLKLLYERIQRLSNNQKLRWAGAVLALILSASVTKAQFNDTVSLSGFRAPVYAAQCFADVDGDGDQDIVIGNDYGNISYVYNNEGEYSYANDNPFVSIDAGNNATPTMTDFDDDGDLDLIIGNNTGTFSYFQNDEGAYTELTGLDNPFNGLDVGSKSDPLLCDLDGDNDWDLISGEYWGSILYYENDGGTYTQLVGVDNPFNDVWVGYYSSPDLADVDDDGDLDLVVGDWYGFVYYYQNAANVFTEQTGDNNPFSDILKGYCAAPAFIDADHDGDLDLTLGDQESYHFYYFRNDNDVFTEKRGQPNPFEGIMSDYIPGILSPAFSDVDNDGDLDILAGDVNGHIFFEYTAEGFVPMYGDDDPFDGLSGQLLKPVFMDMDKDGDEDLVVGDYSGVLRYFTKEDAAEFYEMFGDDNPFNGIDVGHIAAPALTDFDEDGDIDLFVGCETDPGGEYIIAYYRNVSGNYIEQTGTNNPFDNIFGADPGQGLNPVFHDVDRDGDEDMFIGLKTTGIIEYAWNNNGTYAITDSRNPFLDIPIGLGAAATFADVDEDGDKDFYAGGFRGDGGVLYMAESTQGPPESIPVIAPESNISIYAQHKTIVVNSGDQLLSGIEVYNLAGIMIYSNEPNVTGLYELPMSDVQSGLYLVRVYSNDEYTTNKVFLR